MPMRRIPRAIVLALGLAATASAPAAAAAPTAQPTGPANVSKLYEDALQRFNQDDYRGAMIQLKNALQRNPRELPSLILMGRVQLKLGYPHAAEEQLKRARGAGADDAQILVPLAQAYLAQGKYDALLKEIPRGLRAPEIEAEILDLRGQALLETRETSLAEDHFLEALKLRPDFPSALHGQARVALVRGAYDQAEKLIDNLLVLTPDDPDVWFSKGEARRFRNDLDGGIAHLTKAISLTGGHLPSRISRAAMLIELDRLDEAQKDIDFVRQKLPKDAQGAFLQALLHARRNDIAAAQEVLRSASQWQDLRDPDFVRRHPQSLLLSGVIHYAQDRFEEAYPFLYRYVEIAPQHAGARKLLGSILLRNGDTRGAVESLEHAVRLAPQDVEAHTLLGGAYTQVNDHNRATAMYERAVALAPKQPVLHTRLALSRLQAGQSARAVVDLETAYGLEGPSGKAGPLLALVHLQRGDYDEVHRIAARLAAQDPKNPVPHNFAGAAYMRVGDDEQARAGFEKALEIDRTYKPARFNLALLHLRQHDFAGARKHYREILALDANDTQAMSEMSKVAELEGNNPEAIRWLDQVRKLEPNSIVPQLRLVELYMRAKNTRESLLILDQLEIAHPRSLEVLDAKGRAQAAMGEQAKAVETFRRASNIAASTAPQLYDVARAQLRLQDLDGAKVSLHSALRLDPGYLAAYSTLVEIAVREGGLERALEIVAKLREMDAAADMAELLHGDALMQTQRPKEALEVYTRAFEKDPSSRLVTRIYRARNETGEKAAALAFLKGWADAHPDDLPIRRALAAAYLERGDYDLAIREHESLLETLPDDVALANNLAWLYLRRNDPRARTLAERTYRLAPDNAAMLDTYGWILVQSGEAARALPLLREAHARAAQRPEVRFHIGAALEKLGRPEEARLELEAALAIGVAFKESAEARALLKRIQGSR
jgi:putative PEP-CTERM system TPR-repeat lipoprotein